ncbi:SDR family NAD(P)-dependent oxidoreductase [Vibrio olivae]|uniref:SDR family NAD(P)-dependent oxidoreductase n=1 Tax=Vibrio olivae TaxID=1243002 RepID=A0ABV5HKA9_9VIBR
MNHVVITGATSGIGWQLARDYAQQGWRVTACGRNQEALHQLEQFSPQIKSLQCDLTQRQQVIDSFSHIDPKPNLWIFNAGDCEYLDEGIVDSPLIERVFSINFLGLTYCLEAAQPHFYAGVQVGVVGSIASELALPRAGAYGASKAAVSYLVRSLKLDWQPKGIRVSLIFPGFVKTPLTDKNDFDMPMMISVEQASQSIRVGLAKGKETIYFPRRFTSLLRVIALLPYRLQQGLINKLMGSNK